MLLGLEESEGWHHEEPQLEGPLVSLEKTV